MTRPTKSGVGGPGSSRHDLLGRPGNAEDRDDQEESADEHGEPEGRVHPVRGRRDPSEGRSVVVAGGTEA